ncbi:MAG TPA: sulfite exporter TauE/SafE family protein [Acetivibrio clariflavus]|nr:sulfite exporter TauE/SafE family protein [Acetivibrio clariflavus]HPU41766.1 sulfite exporter TauE/SafE family protein [Acetivibrio clariflavus]
MPEVFISKVLEIKGMTCVNCEMRIEKKLKNMEGIKAVKAVYSQSKVNVLYDKDRINLDSIIKAVEELDYQVMAATDGKKANDREKRSDGDYKLSVNQLLGIVIIVLAVYLAVKNTVGFNFIPQVNRDMGYGMLFTVGLLTSLHCIAMCGGINLSQCIAYTFDEAEKGSISKLKPTLLYNGGRVISYTVIGGLVGALGSLVSFPGRAKGIVAIVSGILMIIMGINMLNIFPWLRKINPRMPKVLSRAVFNNNGKRGPFYIGLLNGLMPCGPLQAMQIYALGTGSFYRGAMSMFFFSIGTVPLMFGFGAVSSLISSKFSRRMMKASAVLVIILGIVMTGRGFNLSGLNIAFANQKAKNIARIENGVQLVTTEMKSGSYDPIVVQKGVLVRWTIKADESELNGCNNPVTIPKYNIVKKLVPGDNVIEFMPLETGNINYTCWMGMINGYIKVVDNLDEVDVNDIK